MCLILIAYRYHPRYPLLIAANRDEFHDRPTAPLAFWDDTPHVLAGRDLQEGGAWLGTTRDGRFAALTNYRDPARLIPNAPSRGWLVSAYLQGEESARVYLERLLPRASLHNGFNLLLGDTNALFYINHAGEFHPLEPGLHGLSNHVLDTSWPKVERGRAALRQVLEQPSDPTPEEFLHILTDSTPASDAELPQTGIPLEWERWLSPIFITAPGYGTRSSTVLMVERGGRARMIEVSWPAASRREFQMDWPLPE